MMGAPKATHAVSRAFLRGELVTYRTFIVVILDMIRYIYEFLLK